MINVKTHNKIQPGYGASSPEVNLKVLRPKEHHIGSRISLDPQAIAEEKALTTNDSLLESCKNQLTELYLQRLETSIESNEPADVFKSEVQRFVEISKYFSSPLRRSASYMCESKLVKYPNPCRIEYRRGSVTTQHIKFSNLTLEPVYIKLFKIQPDIEQLKFINLSLSRCKRIPPGLSFNLGFVYDDINDISSQNAKMIFVATKKASTPCYQVCEIDLIIAACSDK